MHNWNDIQHNRQRQTALMLEADTARLAVIAQLQCRPHRLQPVAAWAGRRLVILGHSLMAQARECDVPPNTMYNGAKSIVQQP